MFNCNSKGKWFRTTEDRVETNVIRKVYQKNGLKLNKNG